MLVIFDKKPRKGGIKEYLEQGQKGDRNKKDKRVPLYGDLNVTQKAYLMANKKGYKEAYRNIVLSFEEDEIPIEKLQEIAEDFIKEYLKGYNDDEYVAYAEAHLPKQKINHRGEIRKPHIHIAIATYSPKLQQRLDLGDHKRRAREIELIKELIETKYNLQSLSNRRVIQEDRSQIFDIEKYKTQNEKKKAIENYIYANIQHYNNLDDLINDLSQKLNAQIKTSKNAKTPYISIKLPNEKKGIRLKGELFSQKHFHLAKQAILQNNRKIKLPTAPRRSIDEILKELKAVRAKRLERIQKRVELSRKRFEQREYLPQVQEEIKNYLSYQEKLLKDIYNYQIPLSNHKGFFVKKYENTGYTLIANKKKNIKIIDKGNKIVAKGKNLKEQAKIMLDMAIAKGWKLENIKVNGSDEFKKIANEIIQQKIKERDGIKNQEKANFSPNAPIGAVNKETNEPQQTQKQPEDEEEKELPEEEPLTSYLDAKLQEIEQEQFKKELDLKTLKEVLTAEVLIQELEAMGFIPKNSYEVTDDNKIKVGRKKYNIVDFCLKELHLSFKETSKLLNSVYNAKLTDFKAISEEGEPMKAQEIDWKEIKRTIHPLTLAQYYKIELKSEQIHKKDDEYRIRVDNRNYNIIDYLLKEQGKSFKEIINDIPALLQLQEKLNLQEAKKLQKAKEEKERQEALNIIKEAKKEDLSIFLANLGYQIDKTKSSKNYRVMKNDQGDRVIIYKKGDRYLYFNPQNDQDRGDVYNFFANRGIRDYKQIADIIKNANRNIEIPKLQEAIHSYNIDKAIDKWNKYRAKKENDYSYLTDKRLIDKNILKAYIDSIKSDNEGNIIVPLYLTAEQLLNDRNIELKDKNALLVCGYDRRLKERTENQPKSYINGKKGIAILQPQNPQNIKRIVIAESYIDGLSYIELKQLDPKEVAIISTQGQINQNTIEAIKAYVQAIDQKAKVSEIDLLFDFDKAGMEYADRIKKALNDQRVFEDFSYSDYKDWNEQLVKRKLTDLVKRGKIEAIKDEELKEKAKELQEKFKKQKSRRMGL
ncbi:MULTISPECIES: toprim domain-containing protein [unclassified Nitratiruptor]|uniref:toprim domain-containing protein n=1 Tax=unclassified Nitratiruptor TaxID=2624044 RepID=UPI0018EC4433|nr:MULTISPECIES: toprim domain-containing protein [unclassified Nitratiruptor]BCD61143.1 hypothetical protein NitYY0810_P05 [Nitratiruptor sp. YY08-10]BCD65076.1 hypothetical protein NitYY0814_P05 [Nitratiruptor sp. YY08-14]